MPRRNAKLRSRGGYEAAAVRNLERARRVVTKGDGDTDASVQLMVSSATVYAILELADAIRNASGGEGLPFPAPEEMSEADTDDEVAAGDEAALAEDASTVDEVIGADEADRANDAR
jgi:hypothetical protein